MHFLKSEMNLLAVCIHRLLESHYYHYTYQQVLIIGLHTVNKF